jgi:hypothetical protein
MGKATWRAIKEDNTFYVNMFRRGTLALYISLGINLLLIALAVLSYLQEGMPEHYASDGIRSPILLKAMDAPNMTATYLLPPDPVSEDESARVIPE